MARVRIVVAGILTIVAAIGSAVAAERQYKGLLDRLGPFHWVDLDGHVWTGDMFHGQVTIVAQWASWCGPCVAEFPEMQKLWDAVRRDASVKFVTLNMDRDPAAIGEFLRAFHAKFSFPVLFAGAELKITALPHTWIVDRDGYIRESLPNVSDFAQEAVRLAHAVERRAPVASLPPEVRAEVTRRNRLEAAGSR